MAILSIEIGGQTTRAMLKTRDKNIYVKLSDSVEQYCIPSAFAKDGKGEVHVGYDAVLWKYNAEYNSISVVENDEQTFTRGIQSLLNMIIRRATMQGGEEINRIVVIVPNYYGNNDPRKTFIKNEAAKLGVYNISFIPVHEALCSRQAYIDDSKYVIVFDMGHLGANVSLLQRGGTKYILQDSKNIEEVGGFFFDGIIYRDLLEKCSPAIPNDESCAALANDELERIARFVKERLSTDDVCHCPIPFSNKIYEVNRKEFENKLSTVLGPVYSACQNLVNDASINSADISEVLIWGGSCHIPFVMNRCGLLFKQINPAIKMTNCTSMPNSRYMACNGGLIGNNNSSVTLSF